MHVIHQPESFMLTSAQRDIVKSTVPLLETGGEALITHFYQGLFRDHPEVRSLFNQTHQVSGDQPRALANGVLMYARNIDRLEALGPLAQQIVQKHVSLQVLPEHYPMVGDSLLRAIREVLGAEIATDAVIDAWSVAYEQLADLLIGAEAAVYAGKAEAPGGWRGARAFRVASRQRESAEITSFHLLPADGGPLLDFRPGQFLGLRLVVDGQEVRRNYSLSAAPDGRQYRISVKREPGGLASNHLHDQVHEGDVLDVFPPAGGFTLAAGDKPLVLISGGVGITPTLAMLDAALAAPGQRPVHFIHCARNAEVHAFRAHVDAQAARHPHLQVFYCHDEQADTGAAPHAIGRLDRARLQDWLPADRDLDAYFLGPKPFMAQLRRDLQALGVPAAQSRYEFFGPASALE
jgi:nitric oxide dioxygenase